MAKIYASSNPGVSEREKRNMERSRRIASQKDVNELHNIFGDPF